MKVLVACDGTLQSKEALRYGLEKVREKGGELVAMHVFNSPLFVDYDATPGAEARARSEFFRHVEEADKLIKEKGKGIRAKMITEDGNPDEEIVQYARERHIDLLLCPPRYKSIIKGFKQALKEEGKEADARMIFDETERLKMSVVTFPVK